MAGLGAVAGDFILSLSKDKASAAKGGLRKISVRKFICSKILSRALKH